MNILGILLDAAPKGQGGLFGGQYTFLIFIAAMIVIFYFFMIRPQRKKAKDEKLFRDSLTKGDRVVTIGGIHGKIVETQETTLTIETEGGARMRIERSAIAKGEREEVKN
ncbi:MAG: preprotein translocase subunit YajC [Bacteroidales bacterium]|jgi:preprotein translocase subunit YajC|nr:preprotein translocase subunit YajC [Bacteroidales bacterium]